MSNTPLYSVNPDRTKPWNGLPDLPIAAELYRSVEVYEQLGRAKEALGRLYGRSAALPNQGMLVNSISLQEAKASSAIENIFTTDDELYQAFSQQVGDPGSGPAKEVLRYREALWLGHDYLRQHRAFDQEYFVRVAREVKQMSEGLRPPASQISIRRGNSELRPGEVVYTPPRGAGVLEAKLANLIAFLNDDTVPPHEPLLKMAIAHYQFEAIHPFRDGNGRTGRILNIHYLTQQGLLDQPILYLSRFIETHKHDYYATLGGVSQRGDWRAWLLFMLRAVEATAALTFHKINDIVSARDAVLAAVRQDTRILRPDQLVDQLFTQPITRVKHLTEAGLYAAKTARDYLNLLAERHLLEKRELRGHHYYLNRELYEILAQD